MAHIGLAWLVSAFALALAGEAGGERRGYHLGVGFRVVEGIRGAPDEVNEDVGGAGDCQVEMFESTLRSRLRAIASRAASVAASMSSPAELSSMSSIFVFGSWARLRAKFGRRSDIEALQSTGRIPVGRSATTTRPDLKLSGK